MGQRGLTLLEVMIALAVLAVVASLAMPSFGAAAERARLRGAAETLAADLAQARFEAARRGTPLHVDYGLGPDWCWSVATAPDCNCGQVQACQLKTVRSHEHPGITLVEARKTHFDPAGTAAVGGVLLQSVHGERLRVEVSALGRAIVCTPEKSLPGVPAC